MNRENLESANRISDRLADLVEELFGLRMIATLENPTPEIIEESDFVFTLDSVAREVAFARKELLESLEPVEKLEFATDEDDPSEELHDGFDFYSGRAHIINTQLETLGYTQNQLAELADVSPDTVRRVINGPDRGGNHGRISTLEKIAKALGLDLETLNP